MENENSKWRFEELDNFSFDFIKICRMTDMDKALKLIKEELVIDCQDGQSLYEEGLTPERRVQYFLNYISKYGFFVNQMESWEEFEKCAEIIKLFKIFSTSYFPEFEMKEVERIMEETINHYRETI